MVLLIAIIISVFVSVFLLVGKKESGDTALKYGLVSALAVEGLLFLSVLSCCL